MHFSKPSRTTLFRRLAQIVLTGVTLVSSTACSVFGVESVEVAQYSVVVKDDQFEVRDYAPMVVVQTRVDAEFKNAGNQAFQKLFSYISGNNTADESIAMTSPVVAEKSENKSGEKIAMTAPVTANRDGEGWLYRFVLPNSFTIDTAPKPLDPAVSLEEIPQKRVATVRFAGISTDSAREKNTAALLEWMEQQSLNALSEPRWAGYNAPWALPPFRRNEVLVDTDLVN